MVEETSSISSLVDDDHDDDDDYDYDYHGDRGAATPPPPPALLSPMEEYLLNDGVFSDEQQVQLYPPDPPDTSPSSGSWEKEKPPPAAPVPEPTSSLSLAPAVYEPRPQPQSCDLPTTTTNAPKDALMKSIASMNSSRPVSLLSSKSSRYRSSPTTTTTVHSVPSPTTRNENTASLMGKTLSLPGAFAEQTSWMTSSEDNPQQEEEERRPSIALSEGSDDHEGIVVAAQLSEEAEAQIEEKAIQRILQTAPRAELVSFNNSASSFSDSTSAMKDEESARIAALKEQYKHKSVREKLFGDAARSTDVDVAATPDCIRKRDSLEWSVQRNQTTNTWVTLVHTNQKALEINDKHEIEKSAQCYPEPTEEQAVETGLAMATPRMLPFDENPICHVCKVKFALLRRPRHCRTCGVCICTSCSVTWSSKMIPETYNFKNESQVHVCLACYFVSNSFRDALLAGDYDVVRKLYLTGNLNLRAPVPVSNPKQEVCYPIHLAVMGGNLLLVKWLASHRYCPIRVPILKRGSKQKEGLLLTSKGRSPLAVALAYQKVDIIHYLITEMNMSFLEEDDLATATNFLAVNFMNTLHMLPQDFFDGKAIETQKVVPGVTAPEQEPVFEDDVRRRCFRS